MLENGDTVAIALWVNEDSPVASIHDRPRSYGESIVGLSSNPSVNQKVYKVKTICAQLIDAMDELREATDDKEVKRLASIAITEVESSAMWIVKALTK